MLQLMLRLHYIVQKVTGSQLLTCDFESVTKVYDSYLRLEKTTNCKQTCSSMDLFFCLFPRYRNEP